MEFGVATGQSLRKIRKLLSPSVKLYGFDSFEGLPAAWNGFHAGSFATSLRPRLPNTELVIGPFDVTAPAFAAKHYRATVSFMHIDCDLYESTRTVLAAFAKQIRPGALILFDEGFGYAGFEAHEYRALMESGLRFRAIARWDAFRALIQVT